MVKILRMICRRTTISLLMMVLTVSSVMLSGCGNSSADKKTERSQSVVDVVKDVSSQVKTDILAYKWVEPSGDETKTDGWEVVEYDGTTLSELEDGFTVESVITASYEDSMFSLFTRITDDEASKYSYVLKEADTLNMSSRSIEIDFDKLDLSNVSDKSLIDELSEEMRDGLVRANSIDVNGDGINILFKVYGNKADGNSFCMLSIQVDGTITGIEELTKLSEKYAGNQEFGEMTAVCGKEGCVYFYDQLGDKYLFSDSNNGEIKEVDLQEQYKPCSMSLIGKNIDNTPVFSAMKSKNDLVIFSLDGENRNILYRGVLNAEKCSVDSCGNIIIYAGYKMYIWDTRTGEMENIYSFSGQSGSNFQGFLRNSNGDIVIYLNDTYERGEGGLYRLSYAPDFETKEVVIAQTFEDQYLIDCVDDYNRKHPGVNIKFVQIENRDGLEWNLLTEDIKAGNGPDMIRANRRYLTVLKEASVLDPIDSMLSDESKENIFDGIYRFGEYGDEHYAVPYSGYLSVYMINKKYWNKGSWTIEEAMDAFAKAKGENGNLRRVESLYYPADPSQLLYDLCLGSIENSGFFDPENGTCNFESESFYRLIRFCRENGEAPMDVNYSSDECMEQVMNGDAFFINAGGDLMDYSKYRATLGDDYVCVGIPSDNEVKSVALCYWGIAVNSYSENKDIIADFLDYLVSEECQVKYGRAEEWIRKDVLKKRVKDQSENEALGSPFFKLGAYASVPLMGRKDGTSYADEFIELMDSAVPGSVYYEIFDIVYEESGAYFAGDKTEQEVAHIIQSRVQLYLDEKKW